MILFDQEALDELENIFGFNLESFDADWALAQLGRIRTAVLILDQHPYIGRRVSGEIRELVISMGKRGFVALYHFDELDHVVRILAVRHQREAGYRGR